VSDRNMYLVEITKVFDIKNYILSKVFWKSNFIVQYYLKYFSNNLNSNYSNFFQSIRFLKQQKSILIVLKGRVRSQLFFTIISFLCGRHYKLSINSTRYYIGVILKHNTAQLNTDFANISHKKLMLKVCEDIILVAPKL
jgi:hypothetical protein